jgi:hypothetical protein
MASHMHAMHSDNQTGNLPTGLIHLPLPLKDNRLVLVWVAFK